MVAVDNTCAAAPPRPETGHTAAIVGFALAGSAVAAMAAPIFSAAGWGGASGFVSRFSLLLFIAAMVVEPLSRLIPALAPIGRERSNLLLAFAGASFASVACLVLPHYIFGEHLTLPAAAYSILTSVIVTVMLFSLHPGTRRRLGAPAWRAMQRVATAYFWTAFVLTGVDQSVGPHIPDAWPGFSLLLLTGAFLLRFADAFIARLRSPVRSAG
jgi:hypothetical protein